MVLPLLPIIIASRARISSTVVRTTYEERWWFICGGARGGNANTSSFNFALLIFNKINYKYLIGCRNLVHGKLLAKLTLPQSLNLLCLSPTACGCNFATMLTTSNKKKQNEMLKPIAGESYYEGLASLLWAVGRLISSFIFSNAFVRPILWIWSEKKIQVQQRTDPIHGLDVRFNIKSLRK